MAGPDRAARAWALVTSGLLLAAACSGSKSKPKPPAAAAAEAPQVPASPEPSPPEAPVDMPSPAADTEAVESLSPNANAASAEDSGAAEEEDPSIVMIDTGVREVSGEPETLAEAASRERERRRTAPPTEIVITDKTLAQYATGQLTEADLSRDSASAASTEPSAEETARENDEAYWRNGARAIRQAWRDADERVDELEGEVFELRQRFYAEDDGFYRDSQIKPAWDRAIDQLAAARQEVEERRQELEEFLEKGRRAGALPGWLREGIELEPIAKPDGDNVHEPAEPVIYDQEGSADPP